MLKEIQKTESENEKSEAELKLFSVNKVLSPKISFFLVKITENPNLYLQAEKENFSQNGYEHYSNILKTHINPLIQRVKKDTEINKTARDYLKTINQDIQKGSYTLELNKHERMNLLEFMAVNSKIPIDVLVQMSTKLNIQS